MASQVFNQRQVCEVNVTGVLDDERVSDFKVTVGQSDWYSRNFFRNADVSDNDRSWIVSNSAVTVFIVAVVTNGVGSVVGGVLGHQCWIWSSGVWIDSGSR